MNLRIKALRKHLKMIQEDFAKKIGVQRPTVAWMEKPGNTITNQNVKIICDTFNVNEVWLRTGKGEMFKKKEPANIMEKLKEETTLDDQDIDIIKAFVALTPEQRKKGIEFMEALSENIADLLALENQDAKKDGPLDPPEPGKDSTPAEMPTFCQPFANPVPTSCQPSANSMPATQPDEPADDSRHDITVNDEELALVLSRRQQEKRESSAYSSTNPIRA